METALKNKTFWFRNQEVMVYEGERINKLKRDSNKYYYEIRSRGNTNEPVTIEEEVNKDFWGTMVCSEPLQFGEGDYIILTEIESRLMVTESNNPNIEDWIEMLIKQYGRETVIIAIGSLIGLDEMIDEIEKGI